MSTTSFFIVLLFIVAYAHSQCTESFINVTRALPEAQPKSNTCTFVTIPPNFQLSIDFSTLSPDIVVYAKLDIQPTATTADWLPSRDRIFYIHPTLTSRTIYFTFNNNGDVANTPSVTFTSLYYDVTTIDPTQTQIAYPSITTFYAVASKSSQQLAVGLSPCRVAGSQYNVSYGLNDTWSGQLMKSMIVQDNQPLAIFVAKSNAVDGLVYFQINPILCPAPCTDATIPIMIISGDQTFSDPTKTYNVVVPAAGSDPFYYSYQVEASTEVEYNGVYNNAQVYVDYEGRAPSKDASNVINNYNLFYPRYNKATIMFAIYGSDVSASVGKVTFKNVLTTSVELVYGGAKIDFYTEGTNARDYYFVNVTKDGFQLTVTPISKDVTFNVSVLKEPMVDAPLFMKSSMGSAITYQDKNLNNDIFNVVVSANSFPANYTIQAKVTTTVKVNRTLQLATWIVAGTSMCTIALIVLSSFLFIIFGYISRLFFKPVKRNEAGELLLMDNIRF